MKKILFDKNNGKILLCVLEQTNNIYSLENEVQSVMEVSDDFILEGSWVNVKTNEIVNYGKKPIGCYELTVDGWVLNLEVQIECESIEVRAKRESLLLESDWTDTLSAKQRLGDDLYNQWQVYRQELRDVPEQSGFPLNIVWPTPPT
jgi:hypothetical protein